MKLNKLTIILLILIGVWSCLEPFNATVGDKASSFLVVDGLISNNNVPHTIKLTRSVANIDQDIVPVTDALVIIEDDQGTTVALTETDDGHYETDTCNFRGVPGRTYTLYIKTPEGNEYRSTPCLMKPPSHIDSIYFRPGNDFSDESQNEFNGIGMYVTGSANSDEVKYLRWSYKEDWKFHVRFSPDEIPTPDGGWERYYPNRNCWKSALSNEVVLYSFGNQSGQKIIDKELYFIPAMESDRLSYRYSTLVEQFSISKEEYEFWRKLKESVSDVGSIFGDQPFSIHGNIKSITNPDEKVLGYFQVAGYTSERMYINYYEVAQYKIKIKDDFRSCAADSLLIDSLNAEAAENGTPRFNNMYDIYDRLILNGEYGYELAYSIYDEAGVIEIGLAVSTERCTDCSVSGEVDPPDFWEDY